MAALLVARAASADDEPPPAPAGTPSATASTAAVSTADLAPAPAAAESRPPAQEASVGGRGRVVVDLAGIGALAQGPQVGGGVLGGFAGPFFFSSVNGDHSLAFAPSADVFVTARLSIDARVAVTWPNIIGGGAVTYGASPRVGYALPISSSFAFSPRLGVGADIVQDIGVTYFAEADAGFIVRVSKHVLLDLGAVVSAHRASFWESHITNVDARARVALRLDF